MNAPDDSGAIRRILLPSGEVIEVPTSELAPRNLAQCEGCDSRLVQPLDWQPVTDDAWSVTLRCPECELLIVGVYSQGEVERYDIALDEGLHRLVSQLRGLQRTIFAEWIARFGEALKLDLILPEDF